MNVFDGTVGAGGHAEAILDRTAPNGKLLGMDLDEAALDAARSTLARFGSRAMLVRGNYRDVAGNIPPGFEPVQAALLDLGYSSMEIDDPVRGFSFRTDGPLDMRFDAAQELTAAEIVNSWPEDEIADLIWELGEERYARRIAAALVIARKYAPVVGTLQLVDIIASAVPAEYRKGHTHFATRTFQALRITVNDELGNIKTAIPNILKILEPGARFAIISFHSLEDRIVKQEFVERQKGGELEIVNKKPIGPSDEETRSNPRARSAKLRIAQKL